MKHRHFFYAFAMTVILCSCRTSQNMRLHTATGDRVVAETSIGKLQETAEQLRVQEASIERHPEFSLGTIEFNDEGLSFSREQRQAVTTMIRKETRDRGALIIVFIHGWKHNAAVCDTNLSCFRSVLRYLGKREGPAGRRVIGVYLGWRGLTYCSTVGQQLSFWTRKRIGERLGTNQARRVINDLLLLHNEIKQNGHPDNRFIAVGHSLGAGVLFSAIGPMYRQALKDAIEENKEAAPGDPLKKIDGFQDVTGRLVEFPDLVVLANPAFEAELYKRTPTDLADLHKRGVHFSPQQFPLLLSISSAGDTATRVIFPVGETIRTLFSPIMWLRGPSYLYRNIITAANYRPYITDVATAEGATTGKASASARPGNCFTGKISAVTGGDCGCGALSSLPGAVDGDADQAFGRENRQYGKVQLKRLPSVDLNNPFIVATAARSVLRDHNDIFNPTFMSLLIDLVHRIDEEKKRRR